MANTIDFILTNSATELIPKVLSGKTLNFTRMAVGDGFSYDSEVAKGYKALVNEVLSLDITKKEIYSPSSVRITSVLKNTDAQQEFYYREVGLYAQDPDTGEEVLYAYGNRNDAAELITPAGNNVVTKQLIFIIAVGDSANVTFNINADIYALQSDMLGVQANIEQIQTDLDQAQTDITTLQSNKANKNLNNTGMITNCLLEVPQDIKLELSNGTLTLKSGSKVYIPNGFESDGVTPKFDEVITTRDYSSEGAVEQRKFVFSELTAWNANTLNHFSTNLTAGSTKPAIAAGNRLWYDTVNNIMMSSSDGGTTWTTSRSSLPFCMATNVISESDGVIDQVFNGMGYLGPTVWINKGVKGLIPNGRNPDGTLKNIEHKIVKIGYSNGLGESSTNCPLFIDKNNAVIRAYRYFEQDTEPEILTTAISVWYNPSENKHYWVWKNQSINDWTEFELLNIGRISIDASNVITSIVQNRPFQAVDKVSDKAWLSGLSMPSERYIEYELGPNDSTYVAPANGYFSVRCTSTNIGYFILHNNTTGVNEERQPAYAGAAVTPKLGVRKGDVVQIVYNLELTDTKNLRFYYAQGEVE